jgi:hypothetical protein
VSVLPCQDFDEFLASNHLRVRQASFITDLPNYIIPMGRCIIEENEFSKEVAPDLSWLPSSPSVSSRSGNTRPTIHARHSSPASSPSSTFCHGERGPTRPITLPLSGGPLWQMSTCLGWQTRLTHPSACPTPVIIPPGLALASPQGL